MSEVKLYQGDCLEVMKNIPDNSINCIVTSPPYNKKYFANQKKTNQIWSGFQINYNNYDDNLPIEKYEEWMVECLNTMFNKLSLHGSLFFNHKPIRYKNKIYHPLQFILQSNCPIYQEIIWDRKNSPNIRNDVLVPCTERIYWIAKGKPIVHRDRLDKDYYSEVWKISASKDKKHPAPFPEQLVKNCIFLSSEEDDIILDPFMGCGTTGLSCLNTNRNFIGIELDSAYFQIAKDRIEQTQLQKEQIIMKYKWYKNPIKYIKEIKQKALAYEALFQYLLSCISLDIDYQEVKNGDNVVLARYPKKYIVNYNVDLNKLYGLIGVETGIKE